MKKNILKQIVITLSLTVLVCTGILVVHIYSATHKQQTPLANKQLSRIDFLEPIDSVDALNIRYQVASMPGVESTYFNHASNILVYTYAPDKQTSAAVFENLLKTCNYKAKRYVVSQEELASGCPIGNHNSFTGKVSAYITALLP